jgi:hypothetical protein
MKKHKLFILSFLVTVFFLSGCKKDSASTTYKIQGLWVGTVGNSTSSAQSYSFAIKTDGKISFETFAANQYHFGVGTWTLNGNTFTANVTTLYGISSNVGTQQQLTATFNSTSGVLSNGTWINISPATGNGTFSVTKVN